MRVDDYNFDLPETLIAQHPTLVRDQSRLLVYNRQEDRVTDHVFEDLSKILTSDDFLVFNNSKVIPARIFGSRENKDEHVEFLLLKSLGDDQWEAMARPGKKAKIGSRFYFGKDLALEVIGIYPDGIRKVQLYYDGILYEILDKIGSMPLPPYIHEKLKDPNRYQTIYAKDPGSAAAPTAGLHFTERLLQGLSDQGIGMANVSLHVGLGTFRPIMVDDAEKHKMHEEHFSISEEDAQKIEQARKNGKNIVAVGTTTVRTLEAVMNQHGKIIPCTDSTNIFIYPGYEYKIVNKLITNFHLPKSTLLMLVSALLTREKVLELYRYAVEKEYRFFSFGDAMLIE
ncbi:MAG: tRNA preQ1(34) S-adenosylmethionine ribosyltransferase-isomerase QueA [Tissierellia bacterium]|nr:tRNA preQ1(34) S-adenosylmethionine ribosyltransferase-isomerase QueA [Tissierellia bacterium]